MTDTVQVPREATEFLESITDEQWEFIADHRPDLIRRLLATAKTERAAAPQATADYVQVPREATEEMKRAGLDAAPSQNVDRDGRRMRQSWSDAECAEVWAAMLAAAPQATDPRDCPLGLDKTPTLCSAGTCHTCLSSRIATLTAERDAAWRVLEKIAEYDWVPAYAIQALYHVQGLARAALTTQPSKTETRDEG